MANRRIYDHEKHVHFIPFSYYRRRQFLQQDQAKRIVTGQLGTRLAQHDGLCTGFVVMPDHVHALVWFPEPGQVSGFMNKWKDQSSHEIKKLYRTRFPTYWKQFDDSSPVWQARYYDFNIWPHTKVEEKLDYNHLNAVRAGLVERAVDYRWSSAASYPAGIGRTADPLASRFGDR